MDVVAPTRWCRGRKIPVLILAIFILLTLVMFYGGPQLYTFEGNNAYEKSLRNRLKDNDDEGKVLYSDIFEQIQMNRLRNDSAVDDDDEFMKEQAEIQRQRHKTLQEACARFKVKPRSTDNVVTYPKRFIVDERANLVYCSVAKIASTNWRLVFEQLAGLIGLDENKKQKKINKKLKKKLTFLNELEDEEAYAALGNSLTFMFTRHPFTRVLSSYRNKLEPNSTFERAYHWQDNLGEDIIKLYRHHKRLLPNRETRKTPAKKARDGYDLKFSEFVRFLGDMSMRMDKYFYNIHWCEASTPCDPCNVRYDVIGKLETIETDAKYILKLAKLDGIISFPGPETISSPTYSYKNDVLERYLRDVPAEYIWNLYHRYRMDFALFDYQLPPIAVKKIQQWNDDLT